MRRFFLLLLLSVLVSPAFSQQQAKNINLDSSELLKGIGKGLARVIKPVFSHEGSTLAADSADFSQELNTFDAFGNILITQADGTTIRSDLLNYNGNTRIALLTNNVRLVDKGGAVLTTNFLTYNMASKIGTYVNDGKIVNGEDVLTSKNGYYFANTRDAYFRYNVTLTNKDAVTKSDTMRYNAGTKIAYFYGPTHIYGKKDTVYTESGIYNTVTRQANAYKNNIYQQGSRTLTGDTILYDDIKGFGRALHNITFNDEQEKFSMNGDVGVYIRADSSTLVTKNAYVVLATQDSGKLDPVWLTADTLVTRIIPMKLFKPIVRPDTELEDPSPTPQPARNSPPPEKAGAEKTADKAKPKSENKAAPNIKPAIPAKIDSLETSPPGVFVKIDSLPGDSSRLRDTSKTRIVIAYHHVKIFKSDLQAKADSAFYSYADSTVRTYINPMVWSQGSQLSADTILMQLKNNKLDNMLLQHNGFIVSTEGDSTLFNQVKGKVLTGYFKANKLERMFVDGNAESIYYARDSIGATGMNRSISSRIKISFADNKLNDILFARKPEMAYYPIAKIPADRSILDGFIWKPKERPRSKEEVVPSLAKATENKPVVKQKPAVKPSTIPAVKPAIKPKK